MDLPGAEKGSAAYSDLLPRRVSILTIAWRRKSFSGNYSGPKGPPGMLVRSTAYRSAVDLGSRSSLIDLMTLDVKCARAGSAGNPHAMCAMWRVLETEPWRFLNGHQEENLGHSQGGAYGLPC